MKEKHRLVIIYRPNGTESKYCTKDINPGGGNEYQLAETIVAEPGMVKIALKEDGKVIGRSYVGMPYFFEMF